MKKEICDNQILRSQMLYFDIPDKQIVFKGERIPGSTKMPPMEVADVEPAVKVYENGDVRSMLPKQNRLKYRAGAAVFREIKSRLQKAKTAGGKALFQEFCRDFITTTSM